MAGSYPDVPGRRMAFDADGTVGVYGLADGSGVLTEFTPSELAEMNDEDETIAVTFGTQQPSRFLWLLFPEQREVDGVFYVYGNHGSPTTVSTSSDTTNGRDGTWTQQVADLANYTIVMGNYRTGVTSLAVSAVRGVRVQIAAGTISGHVQQTKAWHVYGEISPGQTPDRLLFIDEVTGLEFGLPKDYGDVPRGSARDFQFRLKNNSTVAGNNLTINTVQITAEALYLNSGAWYTFSNGGAFQATLPLGNLAPEASTVLLTARQIIPDAEVLGLHAGRIRAAHGSLS